MFLLGKKNCFKNCYFQDKKKKGNFIAESKSCVFWMESNETRFFWAWPLRSSPSWLTSLYCASFNTALTCWRFNRRIWTACKCSAFLWHHKSSEDRPWFSNFHMDCMAQEVNDAFWNVNSVYTLAWFDWGQRRYLFLVLTPGVNL